MPTETEQLRRIYESDVVGIVEVDAQLQLTKANKGFLDMLGYTMTELSRRSVFSITHHDDIEAMQAAHGKLMAGDNAVRYQKRYVTKTGQHLHCLVGVQCGERDANGWPTWFLSFNSPLTEIMAARNEASALSMRLDQVYRETAGALARAIEARDAYTAGHQDSVAILALKIGQKMSLDAHKLYGIYLSGIMHDIGKIGVPPEFLSKVTKLTPLEFDFIKQHALFGHDILQGVNSPWPLAQAAYQHHERLDGSGYPNRLMRSDITLEARIVAVADTVDSMIKPRPYRGARSHNELLKVLTSGRDSVFDSDVVDAFLSLDTLRADTSRDVALVH